MKNKKHLVLGAYGIIGTPLVDLMDKQDYKLLYPTRLECNLLNPDSYPLYFATNKPSVVINLAARKTNINLCSSEPASICRDTLTMNLAVLEMCRKYKVEKLVNVVCSCAYPDGKDVLTEDQFWDGAPHQSVLAHALAKRSVYFLGKSYCEQYKMNVVTVALNTVYGGSRWETPTSLKFLDSIIVKVMEAKLNKLKKVYLWGSGNVRREVIHVSDAAQGILIALERYNSKELLNIGSGIDYSIREYAEIVKRVCKWNGEFIYETHKPDGQLIKKFDITKMIDVLEWNPYIDLEEGIKKASKSYTDYIKTVDRRSYPMV